ncbi:MAG: hypothetical protein LBQ22_09705 [Bacteroidales bacterium]|jgi:uncharacterized protein YfaS (alpha-2-macroglobulin family)|nr:hypothetical protein [Bacteroidales bacterium]
MKKTNIIYWITGIALAVTLVFVIISMSKKDKKDIIISDPSLFAEYISAYTNNIISKNDNLTVKLTESFANSVKNKDVSIIKTIPEVKGTVSWKDETTIEFKPETSFKSGENYIVILNLGKLNSKIPKENREFIYAINIKNQFLNVKIDQLPTTDRENFTTQDVSGRIKLNDVENIESVKSCISANIDGKNIDFIIEKINDLEYAFTIHDIVRTNNDQTLYINYNGNPIGATNKGQIKFPIPPVYEFKVLDIQVYQFPEQYINIIFSDPVEEQQLLEGIITLEGINNLKYIIVDNNVKVVPPERLVKDYTLEINNSIKNIHGKKLNNSIIKTVTFLMRKPQLKTNNNGVILPSMSRGQIISFDAVNIKAVDIIVTRIYENNILQFLQTNKLSGNSYLDRVGKVVKSKTIDLRQTDVNNFNEWNSFYINLSEIIKTEPGAIYRIEIGFRQENSIFSCDGSNNTEDDITIMDENKTWAWFTDYTYYNYHFLDEDSYSYDDYYDDYYYDDYYDDYYWDDDDYENPCSKNYYGYKKAIKFNILASDIGLIGKIGKDHKVNAFVTNLSTTDVIQGATIEVFNYQQQLIGKGSSDSQGKAIINFNKKEKPYFLTATYNNQKSYIKLENNEALKTSEFDVSGDNVQNGTKAFIYTDRGVWRPGDSIYVGFIINETMEKLPVGHPIVFDVKNPKGQEIYKEVQGKNEKGFHVFKFKTDLDAPTGYYYATFTMGGKTFTKSLMVETIKPNRLNINLDFNKDYLTGDGSVTATIDVKWLHGTVASDLETDVTISLSQTYEPFKDFKDYNFYNQYSNFDFRTSSLFEGTTDSNGQIKTPVKFDKVKNAPGVLNANLITKVFEKGGNFSIGEKSIIYYPYETFVGMEIPEQKKSYSLPLNKKVDLNIVTVDRNQKLQKEKRQVEVSVYFLKSSWWYDYNSNSVDYITANYNNAISRETITTINGKAQTTIEFDTNGSHLIVVKDLKSGHISSQTIYASRYAYSRSDASESAEILKINADKEKYNVGETININIPASSGKALVSIENSSKIIKTFWEESDGNNLNISFTALPEMAPNIYVNITFIQKHSNAKNDRPIRMYGIIPVSVEDPATRLHPVINMPDELKAESKVKISVSEKDGKPMTYTIAMVDEGLLSLTRFSTPSPWSYFYSKEALGVRTWDIYNQVIGAFTIDAGKMLSIGGGAGDFSPENMKQALRFKPMVKFLGPFRLDAKKSQTHEIQLPQYIGSVRTMVIAAEENSFGSAEKTTPVTQPLMILGTAPRTLAVDESFKLPVTIFAMKPEVKNVTVSVKTNGLLQIEGNSSKNVTFSKTGEDYINFDLKTGTKTGVATIEIIAVSGSNISKYNIELDVRHVNVKVTDVIDGVKNDEDFKLEFEALGIEGTNEALVEIYSIMPLNLESRLDYLITYPHGCIEQITSAAFPQLYLDALLQLDEKQKALIQRNVNICINNLEKYMVARGGFSYWPGNSNVSDWGTTYAGHFMLEAEKQGYTIPANMKTQWINYQKEIASKWTNNGHNSQLEQAYRLYTLALAGQADRSAMNRLKETSAYDAVIWRLALAYSINGKENIAKTMIENLSLQVNDYLQLSGTFGSSIRDKAMILEVLTEIGEKEKAFLVYRDIASILGSNRYCNTQATAYSLMAISKFSKKFSSSNAIDCIYNINGKDFTVKTSKPTYSEKLTIKEKDANKFVLRSNNNEMLYIRIVRKGIPAAGNETAESSNINMDIKYTYFDGTPIDVTNIPQGTDFIATITLKNISPSYSTLSNTALTQVFPSGWEIINSRMFPTQLGNQSYYEYQDIRDDRVLTYFDMNRHSVYTYHVMLNASYEGTYYLPAVVCETMYDNANYARTKGMWVKVRNN